ncbi:hypothetical protein CLAFUW4_03452 [Fulvia fulva]|uniref:N-acetyltransferase domain-containing protein n=1 Tax=Passalora fulva TaxID=5499 RepID=A0A9Q8L929_PASFU|nr:uncharacterized protein CLAFUR5_03431 [Fulvia fulva]KAK4631345.1 hypothetical protein CLAFUR4_03441 [Fulvia fulva]KAK4633717.1 hypothetical protein CLAFUR0_03446 [Fulvia fulva]UJO13175.1 hypothetical protein CLAFUR5_03431 [Fulvia fulva]WPV10688.1 hypothetical protein CLAFUW4_03452 [Fulvia fulva]WPV26646.1 hypothetical protein CLAFUW7_03444 [Fulvia fulva]
MPPSQEAVEDVPRIADLGPEVDTTLCAIPDNTFTLKGKLVTLERIDRSHMQSLSDNLQLQSNGYLFDYLPWTIPKGVDELWSTLSALGTEAGFVTYVVKAARSPLNAERTVEDSESKHSDVLGIISYLNINNQHRDIEVGGILFGPALQRTTAATEMHYLLLKNVLDPESQALAKGTSPPYRRVTWKCNALNKPSRRAAERL